jgi:hypothetical protein
MGVIFMKFNKKFFNWSAWITLIISYVLPYQSTDGFAASFGYPFSFLTVYNTPINTSLLRSESLNLPAFAINILIIYFIISFVNAQLAKAKSKKDMNEPNSK